MNEEELLKWRAEFHKALGNPYRLRIVDFLLDGERCQCEIVPHLGVSQSTASAYLSQLVRAGILRVRRQGTRKLYSIAHPNIEKVVSDVRRLKEDQRM